MNIIWKRSDGSVSITSFMIDEVDPATEIKRLIANARLAQEIAIRDGVTAFDGEQYLVDEPVATNVPVPPKCEFRNAMVWDGKRVVHDIDRARDLRRAQLRLERLPALTALDIDYQRADERSDTVTKATIAARKQALRDITKHPAIDKATTLDDLRAVKLP